MPAPKALALATSVSYPGTTEHIRIVRADLRAVLHECPIADDVILCASELAANAVIHSRSRQPGGTFTVRVKMSPAGYVWVEVEDDGGPSTPVIRDSTGHHGLDIVRALANDWGIDGDHTARTIWARFDRSDRPYPRQGTTGQCLACEDFLHYLIQGHALWARRSARPGPGLVQETQAHEGVALARQKGAGL